LTRSGQDALDRAAYLQALADHDRALGLWRGDVLADLVEYEFVSALSVRLHELRLTAIEARIEAQLALGRHQAVVTDLDQLTGRYPLRERLHAQRMLALYRCGRQSDALAAYRKLHSLLDQELGIQPSPPLQQLQRAVLAQDPTLTWQSPTEPVAKGHRARVVTRSAAPGGPPPTADRRVPPRSWILAGSAAAIMLLAGSATAVVVSHLARSSLRALPANSVGAIHGDGSLYSTVGVGQSPDGLAYGAGSLWVTNTGDRTVSRIDPHSHTVQTIPVGRQPTALTVTGQDVWVVNSGDGTLSRINATVNQVVGQPIEVGTQPDAIASGPSGVWVANSGDDTIQRIDQVTGTAGRPIDVGDDPDGIAADEHAVWVANGRDATVSQVGPTTGAVSAPIHVGAGAAGIAITADGVWVANSLELTVTRIDPASGRVVDTIPVGDGPRSIVAAGRYLWVGDQYDGTVTRIDPAHAHEVRRFAIGASPTGGTLTVASQLLPGSFTGIDPAEVYAPRVSLNAQRVVYDGLVAFRLADGPDGLTVVPDLAAALPRLSDDGRTYTFTLRPEIRYSTGSLVRASDFVLGMRRALTHHGGNPGFFAAVLGGRHCIDQPTACDLSRGMTADDSTGRLVIHLAAPDPEFLYKLAYFVYPTPPSTPLTTVTTPIPGTGPYMISDYKLRTNPLTNKQEYEFAALIRNPHFHQWSYAAQPAGYPDVIRWLQVTNGAAGVDAVLHGRADAVFELGAGQPPGPALQRLADSLATRYPAQLHVDVLPGTEYEFLNTRVRPFDDRRVRQAVNYAVDRRELVKIHGGSAFAAATCQILPPNFPSYERYCPYTDGPANGAYNGPDLNKARALVAESGTARVPITVYGQSDPPDHAINAYFVRVLRQLFDRVSLHELPFCGRDADLPR
jgi:ABC-type transport system substrate-binding protein/streptogramin lyase